MRIRIEPLPRGISRYEKSRRNVLEVLSEQERSINGSNVESEAQGFATVQLVPLLVDYS